MGCCPIPMTTCLLTGMRKMARACVADFNCSGAVSVQDVFDFLGAYFAGDPHDVDGSGTNSVQDIFDFLAAYFEACP